MTVDTSDLVDAYTDAARAFNEIVSPASIAQAKQRLQRWRLKWKMQKAPSPG